MYEDLECKKDRSFVRGDRVRVPHSRAKTDKWILGTIIKVCDPRTNVVRTGHKLRYDPHLSYPKST